MQPTPSQEGTSTVRPFTDLLLNPSSLMATKGAPKGRLEPFPHRLHLHEVGRAGRHVWPPFPARQGCPAQRESSRPGETPRRNVCSGRLPLQ